MSQQEDLLASIRAYQSEGVHVHGLVVSFTQTANLYTLHPGDLTVWISLKPYESCVFYLCDNCASSCPTLVSRPTGAFSFTFTPRSAFKIARSREVSTDPGVSLGPLVVIVRCGCNLGSSAGVISVPQALYERFLGSRWTIASIGSSAVLP